MTDLVAFLAISAVVIATPGQDTALTVRSSLSGGRLAGIATAVGVATGQSVWTLAASTGLAALLVASEPVFEGLRVLGAAYLMYLGAHSLVAAIRGQHREREGVDTKLQPRAAYRQGLLSNLGNPKMVIFFTSLLPQFVGVESAPFAPLLLLGLAFCAMTFLWLALYSFVVDKAGDIVRRSPVRRLIDAITGITLTLFGLRLATERG